MLESINETIESFNVTLEIDNIATIKDLIRKDLDVSILARSACMDEIHKRKITILPIENFSMIRETNLVYHKDFSGIGIFEGNPCALSKHGANLFIRNVFKMKKRKTHFSMILMLLPYLLVGGICGISVAAYFDELEAVDSSMPHFIHWGILLLGIYAVFYIMIILHEGGHLLFGHLTGYHFLSFRIGSFMWIKQDGKLCCKRYSLAGTGGQCIMAPPDLRDGRMPYVLYNLGGSIINGIVGLLCFLLHVFIPKSNLLSPLLFLAGMFGLLFALMNGLPLKFGNINNDGCNLCSIHKDNMALRAFWVQMKIAEKTAAGVRLRDMPEDWFILPIEADKQNIMIATIDVFACNRLLDGFHFESAERAIDTVIQNRNGILGIHQSLLICDKLYLAVLLERGDRVIEGMLTEEQKKFMKAMRNFPSVLRTEYALALGYYRSEAQAATKLTEFERIAARYPYESDIESERELIQKIKR